MNDKLYKILLFVAALIMPIVCGGVVYALVTDAYEAFEHFGFFKFLTSSEWNYTEGRAEQIVEYLKAVLQKTESVELWKVWLMDYYEFEDRPYIHRKTISVRDLTTTQIKEIDDAVIWNTPDRMYPERPSFYCLTITR